MTCSYVIGCQSGRVTIVPIRAIKTILPNGAIKKKTILPNWAIKKLFCQMRRSKTILPNGAIYSCANWGDIRIMV
jgi:hypothetical protein